jgi:phosphoribosylformylglycinamidine synthase subunit PurL
VDGIHDVSDGGLGVALAEMAVKSSTGCRINGIVDHEEMFGEGPSRVVVSVPPADVTAVTEKTRATGIPVRQIGTAEGDRFLIGGLVDISIAECEAAWKGTLPAAFSVL